MKRIFLILFFLPLLASAQRISDSTQFKSVVDANLANGSSITASRLRYVLYNTIDLATLYGGGGGTTNITVSPSAESIFDTTIAINAKRYGVTGDGSTDDRVALQNAIYLAAASRKPLFLPKSTYRIASTQTINSTAVGLYIPSYVTIFGDPDGTLIEYDGATAGVAVLYSHQDSVIRLKNFKIDADSTGGSVSVYLSKAVDVEVNNVDVLQGTSYGYFGVECERVTIANSSIYANGTNSEDCITFFNSKFLKIFSNYLTTDSRVGMVKGSGINIISDSTPGKPRGYGHYVYDNEIENVIAGITMRYDSLSVVSYNRLKRIWSFGIRMTSYPNGNEANTGAKLIKIDGNTISQMGLDDTKSIGIVITYGCGDISAINNTIDTVFGCCGGGLGEGYAISNQGSPRFICIGNRIKHTHASGIRNDGDFAVIMGNYVLNADRGGGNGRGIYNEGDYVSVVGNNVNEIGSSNIDYGIMDIGNYNYVEGNSGNVPLLTYRTGIYAPLNVATDFPNTAAGTSSDINVTYTGAAVGDFVIVTSNINPANTSITGYVSATNQVTLRFNNYSGGAIDPSSANISITVKKFY
jgi:hypothetical protein